MNIHACRHNLEVFSETLQALAAVDSNTFGLPPGLLAGLLSGSNFFFLEPDGC